MREQLELLPALLTAHLQLSLLALLVGAALAIPTGIWLTRHERFEGLTLGLASVIQTIPALALLAFMVPALAALSGWMSPRFGVELSSIGYLPAGIALTLYSILPMLRNTVTGIGGVEHALVEAAMGVGMTPSQRLWRVELPQALPVIVAGVRTATVWVVGMATLSTPVGAPSLGNYIFTGLQTRNYTAVMVGCVASAGLALVLDALIRLLDVGVRQRRRPLTLGAALAMLLIGGYALGSAVVGATHTRGGTPVRIGAKAFTEQYILAELLAEHVSERTGVGVERVLSLGSSMAFEALRTGEVDVYVDYSGTLWATVLGRSDVLPRAQLLEQTAAALRSAYGVELVAPLGFENRYALAMREADAARAGVERISELAPLAPELEIAADFEFFGRQEWASLKETYALRFAARRTMDASLMYQALAAGDVDVITAYTTDGRLDAFGLRVIEDDRSAIPPYDAVVLVSPRLVRERPQVVAALRELAGSISATSMRRMNDAVDRLGRSAAEVAAEFRRAEARAAHE